MKLRLFDGGLNTRLDPRLVPVSESLVNINVDSSSGALVAAKAPLLTELDLKPFAKYFAAKQEWVSFDEETEFLEFQSNLYYTREGQAYKYDGTTESGLGINLPPALSGLTTLHPGAKWADIVDNGKDGASKTIIAIGNKGDKEWSHTLIASSHDLGETWTVKEFEDITTQWLSLTYRAATGEYMATGEVASAADYDKLILLSPDGDFWQYAEISGNAASLVKIWNVYVLKTPFGTLDITKYFALVQTDAGVTSFAWMGRVILGATSDNFIDPVDYSITVLANTTAFAVNETGKQEFVVVMVNNTATLQRYGLPSIPYTSFVEPLTNDGYQAVTHSYHAGDAAKRFLISSTNTLRKSTTGASGTWSTETIVVPNAKVTAASGQVVGSVERNYVGLDSGVIMNWDGGIGLGLDGTYEDSTLQSAIKAVGQVSPTLAIAVDELGRVAIRNATTKVWPATQGPFTAVKLASIRAGEPVWVLTDTDELWSTTDGAVWTSHDTNFNAPVSDMMVRASNQGIIITTLDKKVHYYDGTLWETVDVTYPSILQTELRLQCFDDGVVSGQDSFFIYDPSVMMAAVQLLQVEGTDVLVNTYPNLATRKVAYLFQPNLTAHTLSLVVEVSGTTQEACNINLSSGVVNTQSSYSATPARLHGLHANSGDVLFTNTQSVGRISSSGYVTKVNRLGSSPTKFIQTGNGTYLFHKYSTYYMGPAAFSPYWSAIGSIATPYLQPNRGLIAASDISGTTGNAGIAISNLPSPQPVVRMFNTFGSLQDYFELGDTVGEYQWTYTYYNDTDDTESAPAPLSSEIAIGTLGNSAVVLGVIASPDPQVTHIRIYRIGGPATEFTEIAELANVTQLYIDYLRPYSGRQLDTDNNYSAPIGAKYLAYYNGRFFTVVDTKLYFSDEDVNPNYWPPENYINLVGPSTGLVATANGLYVFFANSIYLLTGSDILTYNIVCIEDNYGTTFPYSIVTKGNTVLFTSIVGVHQIEGITVELISRVQLGTQANYNVVNAVWYREAYYIQTTEKVLVLDLRFHPTWQEYDMGTSRLITGDALLLAIDDTLDALTYELFKGDEPLRFEYVTPRIAEVGTTHLKSYNVLYIAKEGEVTVEILIDGLSVTEVALLDKYVQEVQVPMNDRRGYDIQFRLSGTGAIYELDYSPKGREK